MATKKTVKKVDAPIDQHETFVSLQKSFADSEMSVSEKLKTLYELQAADSEMDKIIQLRGELPAEVEVLENEIADLKARSAQLSAVIEQLNRNIADAKLSIAEHESTEAFIMPRGQKYFVCYGKYATMEEAQDALQRIKVESNNKAWILTK